MAETFRFKIAFKRMIFFSEQADRGLELFFKCENLQKTGAFKARGACNAILREKEKYLGKSFAGVVTHSSGNHGQAVAWAASKGNQ